MAIPTLPELLKTTVDMEGFGSIAIIADPEGNALGIWKK